MKIAVFGVTGPVGIKLLQAAIERGIEVKALVRSPEKLGDLANKVEVIQGDYFDREMIFKTIEGTDAVVSTLGPPVGRHASITADDFETGMKNIVSAMEQYHIKRFINLGGSTTSYKGESLNFSRKCFRLLLNLMAPIMLPAKEKELAVLINSSLDWTNFRPPVISDKAKGKLHLGETELQGMKVQTDQLVNLMLDSLYSTQWLKKAPIVGTK